MAINKSWIALLELVQNCVEMKDFSRETGDKLVSAIQDGLVTVVNTEELLQEVAHKLDKKIDKMQLEMDAMKTKNESDMDKMKAKHESDMDKMKAKHESDMDALRSVISQ